MKVLHIVPSYIPAYGYGGPVKLVHDLCKGLVKKNLEISVFTTDSDSKGKLSVPLNEPQYIDGVRVIYYPVKFLKGYCYSAAFGKAVQKDIMHFDLVHIHAVYLYTTLLAANLSYRYNKPYLLHPFGALDPDMIKLKGYLKKSLYINLVERNTIKKAWAVHVDSNYEKERFLSLGFKAPVIIIPVGLDLMSYERPAQIEGGRLLRRFPQLKNKRIILFLGRIHFKKGLDLLAKAFKIVSDNNKDAYLLIVGAGEEGYTENIKELFKTSGILDKTVFSGFLLGEEKLEAFYGSDLFILPSRGENFGIAVLEAMACGLPVIISDRVGLCQDVAECNAGIITDCETTHLAEAMLNLLNNDDLRRRMSENGRRLVADKFTIDKVSELMVKVYERMLDAKSP